MRESYWGYAVIFLGIIAIITMWFIANVTRTDQNNYNLLKETVEAAMYDSIDLGAYRTDSVIIMQADNFVESFLRRFSENADLANDYLVEIFDINEDPPKVSLRVTSTKTSSSADEDTGELIEVDITNNIDAILESRFKTTDYNKSNANCDSTNHCIVSVNYLTSISVNASSKYKNWTVYPKAASLPESILQGYDASKLKTKIIAARWLKDKSATLDDIKDNYQNKCNWFSGYDVGSGYKTITCPYPTDSVVIPTTYFKIQPYVTSVGGNRTTALKLEAYYNGTGTIANWIQVDWEYWVVD